jgi:hypothetical protein
MEESKFWLGLFICIVTPIIIIYLGFIIYQSEYKAINIMLLSFNIFVWIPIYWRNKNFVKQYQKIISIIIVILILISISYLNFGQLFHISFVLILTYLFYSLMYFSFIANNDDRDTILEIWKLYFSIIVLMIGLLFNTEEVHNQIILNYILIIISTIILFMFIRSFISLSLFKIEKPKNKIDKFKNKYKEVKKNKLLR